MAAFDRPEDFYATYDRFKAYERPSLKTKHIRWFDAEFWRPATCDAGMAFLEIGCGTGQFLMYLRHKGADRFTGVEPDRRAVAAMEPELSARVVVEDIWQWLERSPPAEPFDRVAMLDVLEHFSPVEGVRLLRLIRRVLKETGAIVVRVPNVASPWGQQHQFSDLTHKAAYTPGSLRQLCQAAGYECITILGQRRGSPMRRLTEDLLHRALGRLLTEPPPLWSANMIAVLKPSPTALAPSHPRT